MTKLINKHCNPQTLFDMVGKEKSMFLALCEIFFRDSDKKMSELKHAAMSNNFQKLGSYSHSLKGTVGPFDASKLVNMLQELEDECDQGKCACGPARIAALRDELMLVTMEVNNYIAQL